MMRERGGGRHGPGEQLAASSPQTTSKYKVKADTKVLLLPLRPSWPTHVRGTSVTSAQCSPSAVRREPSQVDLSLSPNTGAGGRGTEGGEGHGCKASPAAVSDGWAGLHLLHIQMWEVGFLAGPQASGKGLQVFQ